MGGTFWIILFTQNSVYMCACLCVYVCVCVSERETEFEQFSKNFSYIGGFPGGSNGKESACNAGDKLF